MYTCKECLQGLNREINCVVYNVETAHCDFEILGAEVSINIKRVAGK